MDELEGDLGSDSLEVPEDAAVTKLNEARMEYVKELRQPAGLQNVTMVEILESRHISQVLDGMSRIFGRMKALGVPILRIHSGRGKTFLSKGFQKWRRDHSLYQTMTSGDDGPANGRVEAEVNQIKRRLRLVTASSNLGAACWPAVAGWTGEERLRMQLSGLGVPSKPMIPLGERVVVKTKRLHKTKGPLSAPFKTMTLMGPSPTMSSGWVLRDGKMVQHARTVVRPSPHGEKAILELYDASKRRLVGKQPFYQEHRKVAAPVQHGDLPPELQDDLGFPDDSRDVWGEPAAVEDRGEDVESLAYSPDELPHSELPGPLPAEVEGVAEEPALRAARAGGSLAPQFYNFTIWRHSFTKLRWLWTFASEECGFCGARGASSSLLCLSSQSGTQDAAGISSSSLSLTPQSGLQRTATSSVPTRPCGLEARLGHPAGGLGGLVDATPMKVAAMRCSTSLAPGSHGAKDDHHSTLDSRSGVEDLESDYGERAWDYAEVGNPAELIERLHREHWGWKQQGMKSWPERPLER